MDDAVQRVRNELRVRGLKHVRPHFYLADEWLSPDGVPGVGIPFFLAHPRLMKLERKLMYEVEGATMGQCMRLLRHEVGHAVHHAYHLQRRRRWQQLFGLSSTPYPESYTPRPKSKRFVVHLDGWYAQSHPDEDFAETFAVWLDPRSAWRRRYANWPALEKLEYVDAIMAEVGDERPVVKSKARPYAVKSIRQTLGDYYETRRQHYSVGGDTEWDRDLRELFDAGPGARSEPAAAFLRRHRKEIREIVARWTGEYMIAVDLLLKEMIARTRDLKLRTVNSQRKKYEFMIMLTKNSMSYVYKGKDRRAV